MKTKYQYIHFIKIEDKPKTSVWACRNNRSNEQLGLIKWYSPWRQYCYFPTIQAVYNTSCLGDIADFIYHLESERTNNLKQRP